MSPHANANKRDVIAYKDNHRTLFYPPPLKINKDSHSIKKSSPSSSSGSPSSSASSSRSSLVNAVAGAKPSQQQRHPVIIYTHSPKIIHTHPGDFMVLVQKLTGRSRFEDDVREPRPQPQPPPPSKKREVNVEGLLEEGIMNNNRVAGKVMMRNEDIDSSSVITTEENCSTNINSNDINNNNNNNNVGVGSVVGVGGGDGQVSSCFMPPNPYIGNIPVFTPTAADFLCSNSINHLFTTI